MVPCGYLYFELYASSKALHLNECAKLRGLRGSRGLEKLRGSWVVGRGSWDVGNFAWVVGKFTWVVGPFYR